MFYPNFIKPGDVIAVPAPSDGSAKIVDQNRTKNAVKHFESLGYKISLSENSCRSEYGRSVSAKERAAELNEMLADDEVKMIFCLSGGDFLVEILPYVNFELIKKHPKLVAGFSDPTGILFPLTTKYDIATFYGQNFRKMGNAEWNENQKDFMKMIEGKSLSETSYELYEDEQLERITGLEDYNFTEPVEWKTLDGEPANLTGRIIGGCLDVIRELAGTEYDGTKCFTERYASDGIIWYFDNCELSMEETIRTLWQLKEAGYFKHCRGVIFGRFGAPRSYYNYDTKKCLQDSVLGELNLPVIYDADASHKLPCMTIINGALAQVKVANGKANINFELK